MTIKQCGKYITTNSPSILKYKNFFMHTIMIVVVTSSPAYRGGGFLSQKSEPSVLVRSHYCTKHKRAIPVCPTVLYVSYAFTSRIPSFRILMAALISLSCCVPHAGHSHARILRFFVSAFWYPQQEQI